MNKKLLLQLIAALIWALLLMPGCKKASSKPVPLSQEHFSDIYDKLTVDTIEGKPILRFEKAVKRIDGTTAMIQSIYPANELLVRLKPGVSTIQLQNFIQISKSRGSNLKISDSLAIDHIYLITIDNGQVINSKSFANTLMRTGLFRYAEPNYYSINFSNQFPYLLDYIQWPFYNNGMEFSQFGGKFDADIDAIEAIGRLKDGEIPMHPVTVAIIDGGIDIFHYALKNRLWKNPGEDPNNNTDDDGNGYMNDQYGWNFKSKTPILVDYTGHGTHVAGVIGADPIPIAHNPGVSYNARLMILKTTDDNYHSTLDIIAALKYAKRMKADVINMSIGSYNLSTPYRDAIEEVINANIPVIAALGNDGLDIAEHPVYPACYWQVMGVANSNRYDILSPTSNYGSKPYPMLNHAMIAAPGESIYSTLPGSNYGNMTGTSMASPHVTGTVALIKSMNPGISILKIRNRLVDGADEIPALMGKVEQGRRLNVYKALFAPSETYDEGIPYRDQKVNGKPRSSLLPYANAHEAGIDGKSLQTAYKIASMKQLMSIRNEDKSAYFVLMNNIDWHELSPNDRHPIEGTFYGKLLGRGFTIKNFDYQSASAAGLFMRLGNNAVIQSIKFSGVDLKGGSGVGVISPDMSNSFINDVQVEGTITGTGNVGGLFGSTSGGQINNCYFEGHIITRQTIGVGQNFGGISGLSNATNMLNCHVESRITGLNNCGGLSGKHSGLIDHCYANGVVKGKENVGGLVGFLLEGNLSDSYAEGEVVGTECSGGLIGKINNNAFLFHCYAYVAVNCPLYNGGLIGKGNSFNLNKCYYLNNGTNRPGAGGIAKSHYEMQQPDTFSGWFPSTSWEMKFWMLPSLKGLPRSIGGIYLARQADPISATINSSINQYKANQIPEQIIWQWDNMTLTAGVSLIDLQIIINSNDVVTISGKVKSNDRRTHLSIVWLGLKLYNKQGQLQADLIPVQKMPFGCTTNKAFLQTMTLPGFFNSGNNAEWKFPPIVLNYCSK